MCKEAIVKFTPIFTSEEFTAPYDVFINDHEELAYLQIAIPLVRVTGDGTKQSVLQHIPRFPVGAEKGSVYFAQFTPFVSNSNSELFDSRLNPNISYKSISNTVFLGPFQLGITGPARYTAKVIPLNTHKPGDDVA